MSSGWSASVHATARAGVTVDDAACGEAACVLPRAAPVGVPPGASASAREGWRINRKRVQRLWREEGLRVRQKRRNASGAGNR